MTVLLQSQIRCCDKPGHCRAWPGRRMLEVFIRSPRLIKGANGSHEVRYVPPRSCAPPRVGLATRLCDFATNRREKRVRHRGAMEPLTCRGLLARAQRLILWPIPGIPLTCAVSWASERSWIGNRRACFIPAGCSKWPSSKAAASEGARRTIQYVAALSDARTQLAVIFNNLTRKGATGFDGDTKVNGACRALGVS